MKTIQIRDYPHSLFTLFKPHTFKRISLWVLLLLFNAPLFAQSSSADLKQVHKPFDLLLKIYVTGSRFNYDRIYNNTADLQRLYNYLDTLETINPADLSAKDALAYWINLYNAASLKLILTNYPVKSIKDLGQWLSPPWKKKVVQIEGEGLLSLNDIKQQIILKKFSDARIHLALNWATIGCPPLYPQAFFGETLDEQLDEAARRALMQENWLKITDNEIRVSKIFDWNKKDFKSFSGSLRGFIATYYPDRREDILDKNRKIKYLKYDWDLNKVRL